MWILGRNKVNSILIFVKCQNDGESGSELSLPWIIL